MDEPTPPVRRYEPLPEGARHARAKVQGVLVGVGVASLFAAVHYGSSESWGAAILFAVGGVVAGLVAFWLVPLLTRNLGKR